MKQSLIVTACREQAFRDYLTAVDVALIKLCGMSSADLPDWCYHDAFSDGIPAARAARLALKYAKDF